MFHSLLKVLVILTFFEYLTAIIKDPCNKDWCPSQGAHVRCNFNGEFSSACNGTYKLVDLTKYHSLILDRSNYYRNLVASGKLEGFPPAVRMSAILDWDPELALNAEANVMSCVFAHDKCRSTERFRYAGQNIYYAKTSNFSISPAEDIEEAFKMWFAEHDDADAELMQCFKKTTPPSGHYTTMVCDRQTAIGCAMLDNKQSTKKGPRRVRILCCDYSSTNIRGMPVYKEGPAASDCEETDPEYPALCDNYINPNDLSWYNEA